MRNVSSIRSRYSSYFVLRSADETQITGRSIRSRRYELAIPDDRMAEVNRQFGNCISKKL